jgi:hypothetical protein
MKSMLEECPPPNKRTPLEKLEVQKFLDQRGFVTDVTRDTDEP